MKKVILLFEGESYSDVALQFAADLNEKEKILLAGIFAPNVSYAGSFVYPTEIPMAGYPLADSEVLAVMEKNSQRFSEFCAKHEIECRVHRNTDDFALPALKYESRFADLMIVSSKAFFSIPEEERISELLQETLHEAECPVLIIPDDFQQPKQLVVAYDGSEDSVFAIKQFAAVFPQLCSKPCLMVYVNTKSKKTIPELSNIEELAARHFPNLTFEKLAVEPKTYFATWLNAKKSPLLIAGSFGRSAFSRMFRGSFIKGVLSTPGVSVFIAHR